MPTAQGAHRRRAGARRAAADQNVPGPQSGVFISYRREDTAPYAGRLYDAFCAHFGPHALFMDLKIQPGDDFVERIEEGVGSCETLVHLIGPRWLTVTDAQGRRRLENPDDFTRLELATALKRGVQVIPVLVGGAEMPSSGDLPEDLKQITRRQAIDLSDSRWDYDVAQLIHAIDDTAAELPESALRPAARAERARRGRWAGKRAWLVAGGLLLLIALVAAVATLGGAGGEGPTTGAAQKRGPQSIPVGHHPVAVVAGGGQVWVANEADGTITRLDPSSGSAVGGPIRIGGHPTALAVTKDVLWVSDPQPGTVHRIDSRSGQRIGTPVHVDAAVSVVVAGGSAWIADAKHDAVVRLDERTGREVGDPIRVGKGPVRLAAGFGSIWVASWLDGTVTRIDAQTGEAGATIAVGAELGSIAAGGGAVWVTAQGDDRVARIDPRTNSVSRSIRVARAPLGIAFGAGRVWFASEASNTLGQIDPRSAAVTGASLAVGRSPVDVAVGYGAIWVANSDARTVTRLPAPS